jgi:para-nitrobenzyl esterase
VKRSPILQVFDEFASEVIRMSAIASTRYGKVEGEEQSGLSIFKGIPFAAPPVGARRWLAPEKPTAWTGTRDARRFGTVCPQTPMFITALAAMVIDDPQSEDCLYLNVWTPAADNQRRPVMVWIHGGAFTIGAGSQAIYDGSTLARRGDVVVVCINYRLGPLGFLRLADVTNGAIPSTGNEGILDQIAALEWVRDNIAEFGGDPQNVTIFGESAGGMSVGSLLAAPTARGLFHKAIPQSGACHTGAARERANRNAERVMTKLGAANPDAMRALTPAQLLTGSFLADGKTPDPEFGGMAYQPVIDGTVIPRVPIDLVTEGASSDVAIMVGSTLDEWKLFAPMDPGIRTLDRAGLAARYSRRVTPEVADGLITSYEKARASRGAPTTAPEIYNALETDRIFRIPAIRLAEVHAKRRGSIYNYLFTWPSPAAKGMLGSCHALELGFVFGTNHIPGMPQFAGTGPIVERLATEIQDGWLAFARTGDPSCQSLGAWPQYDVSRRATMILGEKSGVQDAPYDGERRAWDAIPTGILGSL